MKYVGRWILLALAWLALIGFLVDGYQKQRAASREAEYVREYHENLFPLSERLFDHGKATNTDLIRFEAMQLWKVPRINDVMDRDPRLEKATVTIHAQPQASSNIFGRYERSDQYTETNNVPSWIRVEDAVFYQSQVQTSYFMGAVLKERELPYEFECSTTPTDRDYYNCRFLIEHPDPRIYIAVGIWIPVEGADLNQYLPYVPDRLREISYCLDVTEAVERGDWTPDWLPDNPNLEGCTYIGNLSND